MKTIPILAALTLVAVAHGDVTCDVSAQGTKIGEATFGIKKLGSQIQTTIWIKVKAGALSANFHASSVTTAGGMPVKYRQSSDQNGTAAEDITAEYNNKGVTYRDKAKGGTTKFVAAQKPGSMVNPSESWFITTTPKKGAKATYSSFSFKDGKWKPATKTYLGDETITLGGKTVKAHKLHEKNTEEESDVYVDDKGYPLMFEVSGMHIERRF